MEDWLLDPAIPWPRIYELLDGGGAARDSRAFLARVLKGIETLIPFDVGCGFIESSNAYIASVGMPDRAVDEFNSYYRHRLGFLLQSGLEASLRGGDESLLPLRWRSFGDNEFVEDFCRPLRLGQSLALFLQGKSLSLAIHRKNGTLDFNDTDKRILRLLNGLINARLEVYRAAEEEGAAIARLPTPEGLRQRFPSLSRREAEVAVASARGLTAQEVASRDGLSRRTIETQLASVYAKLGLRDKKALASALSEADSPRWEAGIYYPAQEA
jgi:DNA-binding CsgD family transcriptional regulator